MIFQGGQFTIMLKVWENSLLGESKEFTTLLMGYGIKIIWLIFKTKNVNLSIKGNLSGQMFIGANE